MKNNVFLSIIIVTHNNESLLIQLFNSLKTAVDNIGKRCEIIVVDNNSGDGTVHLIKNKYPEIIIIQNNKNLGYAKANNQGISRSKGELILLLNSDAVLNKDSIKKCIDYLEKNPDVGVITCKVKLENGQLDPACHRGFPTPLASITYFLGLESLFPKSKLFSKYHLYYKDLNTVHEIDSPSGAFFMTRKKVLDTVGLLDESFFMYGEDLDLSYRIKKNGWKIIYNPASDIIHLKKQSGLNSKDKNTQKRTTEAFYDSMTIFYKKNLESKYPLFLNILIYSFIKIKKLFDLVKMSLLWT